MHHSPQYVGWALALVAVVVCVVVRAIHLLEHPELTEMQALIRWWPQWCVAFLLATTGWTLIIRSKE